MTPKKSKEPQGNLSLRRLENITNMDHELVRLADKINEDVFVKKLGKVYIPNKRRLGFFTRPMLGLHYLKGLNNLSDEEVTKGFLKIPTGNIFDGQTKFDDVNQRFPISPIWYGIFHEEVSA